MLALLIALLLPQATAPETATAGALTVEHPALRTAGDTGEILLMVENAGTAADRLVSVATSAGTVGDIDVYVQVGNRSHALSPGDRTIAGRAPDATTPALSILSVTLDRLADGSAPVSPAEVTVTFEHAGAVVVSAPPTGPGVPAPPQ